MLYVVPVLVVAMLGYMFWTAAYRLRRDRLRAMKVSDRSGVILSRRQRARASLTRAFRIPERRPEWEDELLATLPNRGKK
jgi:hypothetical protein